MAPRLFKTDNKYSPIIGEGSNLVVDSAIEVDAKQGIEFTDKQAVNGRRRVDLLVVASIVLLGLGALVSLTGRSELSAEAPEPPQHFCCYYSSNASDVCGSCMSHDSERDWCSASLSQCTECGGSFCRADGLSDPSPTPEPTLMYAPTILPTEDPFETLEDLNETDVMGAVVPDVLPTEHYCCFYYLNSSDACGTCTSVERPDDWCSKNEGKCLDCGGHFCPSQPTLAPTVEPTYEPTPYPVAAAPSDADADADADPAGH